MNLDILLHALTSYFVIIDPVGAALIFHALTEGGSKGYARTMAVKSVCISFLIVLAFGFFGEIFLERLGITIEALRVSGGLLLFYTAFHMITGNAVKGGNNGLYGDISVYPMSIPLLAGPGCLTLTILLFSESSSTPDLLSTIAAPFIIMLLTLVCFLLSGQVKRIIGQTGDDIVQRLLGVVLASLAIQFIADGIKQIAGNM